MPQELANALYPKTKHSALAAVADLVSDLVQQDSIDPRFAEKLTLKLKKEFERVQENSDAPQDPPLTMNAIEQLEHAVNDRKAECLVAAMARLRAEDALTPAESHPISAS